MGFWKATTSLHAHRSHSCTQKLRNFHWCEESFELGTWALLDLAGGKSLGKGPALQTLQTLQTLYDPSSMSLMRDHRDSQMAPRGISVKTRHSAGNYGKTSAATLSRQRYVSKPGGNKPVSILLRLCFFFFSFLWWWHLTCRRRLHQEEEDIDVTVGSRSDQSVKQDGSFTVCLGRKLLSSLPTSCWAENRESMTNIFYIHIQ